MTQNSTGQVMFSFAGKRVLVAGASRGLGRAVAEAFAQAGARVALGARQNNQLAEVASNLAGAHLAGEGHFYSAADFSTPEACRDWAARAQVALGGVDILVVTLTSGVSQSRIEDYQNSFQVDFLAPLLLLEACRDGLISSKGAALFCSSRTAVEYWPGTASYGAAKKGLEYALKCAAAGLAPYHVRVNAIAPGSTHTEGGFWDKAQTQNPVLFEKVRANQPSGRLGTEDDIIPAMLFLVSDAARWVTGQTVLVDGGQTLAQFAKS